MSVALGPVEFNTTADQMGAAMAFAYVIGCAMASDADT